MNLKIHLIIIAMIVAVIYIIRPFLMPQQQTPAPAIIIEEAASPYSISIVHASWGLNCAETLKYMNQKNAEGDIYSQNNYIDLSKIKEDNVLSVVSNLCNGKSNCTLGINTSVLGQDPLPSCGNKVLQIDYRCFTVDKLRGEKAQSNTMTIDCDKQMAK